jgi:type I restriction enzyme R subunit
VKLKFLKLLVFKLPFGNESEKSLSGEKRFDNTAILIVSDMLLTGYDAPIVQCMYIDKLLKEHTLLQAIARVNRTKSGKEYGLVVDYAGITNYLTQALKIFSGDLEKLMITRIYIMIFVQLSL